MSKAYKAFKTLRLPHVEARGSEEWARAATKQHSWSN